MTGTRGNTLLINGTINPYTKVPMGWVRLRLLNGSNARLYSFSFKNGESFYKIATDGGFLNEPVKIQSMIMAPGERNEIMIHTGNATSLELVADLLDEEGDSSWFAFAKSVLQLIVEQNTTGKGQLPDKMNNIKFFERSEAKVLRRFQLTMGGGEGGGGNSCSALTRSQLAQQKYGFCFSINGQPMRMDKVNARVKKGQVEIWRVSGEMMRHPFHVHGCSFQILSHDGNSPAAEDRGWKDVVNLPEEGVTDLIVKFNHTATKQFPYMYHCHILEHEDAGMMGQFIVS